MSGLQLDRSEEFGLAFTLLTPKAREKNKVSPQNPARLTLAYENTERVQGCYSFLFHMSV